MFVTSIVILTDGFIVQCFESVTSILFLASSSEFNQVSSVTDPDLQAPYHFLQFSELINQVSSVTDPDLQDPYHFPQFSELANQVRPLSVWSMTQFEAFLTGCFEHFQCQFFQCYTGSYSLQRYVLVHKMGSKEKYRYCIFRRKNYVDIFYQEKNVVQLVREKQSSWSPLKKMKQYNYHKHS